MEIICIDNKNKPQEWTNSDKWLVEKATYTPIEVSMLFDGKIGVKVAEIELSEENPFEYFNLNRFAVPLESLEEINEMIKSTLDVSNVELNIEELEHEPSI